MKMRKYILGAGIAGFLALSLGVSPIWAQQGTQIAITPLIFEFTANPGETVEGVLRVNNHSETSSVRILMEIEDMFPEGEEGRVRLESPLEERRTFSLSHWIEADPLEFDLLPGEEQRVRFLINVPEDAEPGGYYISVVAGTSGIGMEEMGVAVLTRIGSLVLMTVPGETDEKLTTLGLSAPSYVTSGPVEFSARFENTGTIHVRPDASIVITDMLGRKVSEISLESRNVLPNAVRRIDARWDAGFLLGKYTATLNGTYGMTNSSLNSVSVTFWAFPWKSALVVVAVLLLFWLTRKRWTAAFRILVKGER